MRISQKNVVCTKNDFLMIRIIKNTMKFEVIVMTLVNKILRYFMKVLNMITVL